MPIEYTRSSLTEPIPIVVCVRFADRTWQIAVFSALVSDSSDVYASNRLMAIAA